MKKQVLVVDDDRVFNRLLVEQIADLGLDCMGALNWKEASERLLETEPDLIFLDLKLPDADTPKLVESLSAQYPVVVLTGYGSIRNAVSLIQAGAVEYLTKPVGLDELEIIIRRELDSAELRSRNAFYRRQLESRRPGPLVGNSRAMQEVLDLIEAVAPTDATVLIQGESGTGKEMVAEALHRSSTRCGREMVTVDGGTLQETLFESEIFGHERGAFTGAERARAGVFEEADGGTLLIDEIGDMELGLQAKLLRALDRGEIRRVGSQKQINVNVRVLAATRRDLDKEVAAGRFRDDLFHRLAVARIELPPLRERYGDVPLLIRQFVLEMGGDAQLAQALTTRYADYAWPGNVRELRNLVARHVALGLDAGDEPGLELLVAREPPSSTGTEWIESLVAQGAPFPVARRLALSEFERRYVAAVLAKHNGNVSAAAKASGLALRYFRLVKSRQK